jgi:predicted ester cyclase
VSAQEENKAVIRRLVEEVYNNDDLDVLDELLAQDFVNHSAVPEHQHGIESFKHVNRWVRAGFSDAHYKIEDMIAEGDRVACRITLTGTHDGEFQGSPPTGRRLRMDHVHWHRPPGRWEAGRALGREGRLGGGAATRPAPLLAARNLPTRRTS